MEKTVGDFVGNSFSDTDTTLIAQQRGANRMELRMHGESDLRDLIHLAKQLLEEARRFNRRINTGRN